jgi:hypothetical protein
MLYCSIIDTLAHNIREQSLGLSVGPTQQRPHIGLHLQPGCPAIADRAFVVTISLRRSARIDDSIHRHLARDDTSDL